MGLIKLEKGQILHKAGTDIVSTVEVLVKGSLKISNPYSSITATVGTFIGIVEQPGKPYNYTIEALEESAVYSYPYESTDDIPNVIRSNPKIAPILAAQSTDTAALVCAAYDKQFDDALREYEQIMADLADYKNLCIKVGEVAKEFPELEEIIPPERSKKVPQWSID
ncbi:MAG: cyclic nucleotide-binding domain-containing protein, partial [Butyrivibrio sp.]|nr:cyclic nucleotide-binding domain-containing protein [Butyrivibrio sp.]